MSNIISVVDKLMKDFAGGVSAYHGPWSVLVGPKGASFRKDGQSFLIVNFSGVSDLESSMGPVISFNAVAKIGDIDEIVRLVSRALLYTIFNRARDYPNLVEYVEGLRIQGNTWARSHDTTCQGFFSYRNTYTFMPLAKLVMGANAPEPQVLTVEAGGQILSHTVGESATSGNGAYVYSGNTGSSSQVQFSLDVLAAMLSDHYGQGLNHN